MLQKATSDQGLLFFPIHQFLNTLASSKMGLFKFLDKSGMVFSCLNIYGEYGSVRRLGTKGLQEFSLADYYLSALNLP